MSGDKYIIRDQNAMYFLTFTIIDWVDVFTRKEYCFLIVDSMNYCIREKGLDVFAWVIMSNHIHCIWQAREYYKLSDIIRDFKKFTAKQIIEKIKEGPESRSVWLLNKFRFAGERLSRNKSYKIWKDDNHAIELRPTETKLIEQKMDYIHNNPARAMVVFEPVHYVFSSARDYVDEPGLVKIRKI